MFDAHALYLWLNHNLFQPLCFLIGLYDLTYYTPLLIIFVGALYILIHVYIVKFIVGVFKYIWRVL